MSNTVSLNNIHGDTHTITQCKKTLIEIICIDVKPFDRLETSVYTCINRTFNKSILCLKLFSCF